MAVDDRLTPSRPLPRPISSGSRKRNSTKRRPEGRTPSKEATEKLKNISSTKVARLRRHRATSCWPQLGHCCPTLKQSHFTSVWSNLRLRSLPTTFKCPPLHRPLALRNLTSRSALAEALRKSVSEQTRVLKTRTVVVADN